MITQWYLVFHTLNKMLGFKHTLFMKKTAGSSSGYGSASKNHRKRRSKKLTSSVQSVMSKKLIQGNDNELIPSSVTSVMSNFDLLVEILLRLPVLSLLLFKSVSKQWFSLIISPDFILRRRTENLKIDPSFGLFIRKTNLGTNRLEYDFQSFDIRTPSINSVGFTLGSEAPLGRVEILQSCNGLLLCSVYPYKYYVYNPTINQFKMIPTKSEGSSARMAFDPTKSPHYKVIQSVRVLDAVNRFASSIKLETYLSETDSWSVCGDPFRVSSFEGFKEGVYWNDAIHWLNIDRKTSYFKLDIESEPLVLTELELPITCDGKSHFQSKLFASRGCLLLLGKDHAHSQQLNVYEMRRGYSQWSVKYTVNLDDIMMPFPRTWRIRSCVWSIVLGEREEDSFMVIDLLSKVVKYKPVLKTVRPLADLESIGSPLMVSNFDGFEFIASFAEV